MHLNTVDGPVPFQGIPDTNLAYASSDSGVGPYFCFISMPAVFRRHLVQKTMKNSVAVMLLKYTLLVS